MKKILLSALVSSIFLTACQQKNTVDSKPEPKAETVAEKESLPLIKAKTERVQLSKNEVCHPASEDEFASCTKYHLQTVKTNVNWLNQYFLERLQKDHAEAFDKSPAVEVTLDPEIPSTNYSTTAVRYIGQHYNIANFTYFSEYYPAGAAHGMHHSDYVIFDLNTKQRLSLNDILAPASKEKLKTELYEHNREWLEQHHIEQNAFEVSDNFYFNANGIVFVYPLYELASYAEGITELELPYWSAQGVIQTKYLPQLPESSEEIYND